MKDVEQLVAAAQKARGAQDRRRAFDRLAARCSAALQRQARHILKDEQLAQDAVQDALLAAYQQLHQLRAPAAFTAWMQRIVATQCNRMLRRKGLPTQPIDSVDDLSSPRPDPAAETEDKELREQVRRRVADLPEHERAITVLFYLDGYSQREIAQAVGVPVKTVKSRLYSSRRRLSRQLGEFARGRLRESGCAVGAFAAGRLLRAGRCAAGAWR